MLSWVALAYSLKFLWAPIVDRYDVPLLARLLGRRRGWMVLAQFGARPSGWWVSRLATRDQPRAHHRVGASGRFRIRHAGRGHRRLAHRRHVHRPARHDGREPPARLSPVADLRRRGGALHRRVRELAQRLSGHGGADGRRIGGARWLLPAVDLVPAAKRLSFGAAIVEPLADLFRRKGMILVPILLLVACFRLPDFVAGVMANPLYIDLGFSKADIANVSKIYGVWIGIAGAFAGGIALTRIGLWWTLLIGAVIAAASNLMFAWLANEGHRLDLLVLSISIDNFASGFAGSALVAYMSGLTAPGFAATQYALLSSLYALPGKLIGGTSGAVVDAYGYPVLFTATAAIGIPLVILCLVVRRDTMKSEHERDAADAAPPVEAPSRA